MGRSKGLYKEEYPIGSNIEIVSQEELIKISNSWRKHNPLQKNQLEYGGRFATVKEVSFYHGGDELYVLEGIPGIWHEICLKPSDKEGNGA